VRGEEVVISRRQSVRDLLCEWSEAVAGISLREDGNEKRKCQQQNAEQ
jgi:hypothetical protein